MRNEEYQEIKDQEKFLKQPTFLKRMLAGLIDLAIFLVLFFGLTMVTKLSLFEPLGYNDAVTIVSQKYEESGLYVKEGEFYFSHLVRYDSDKTPEENLEEPLLYFYRNNSRAKEANLETEYLKHKIDSGLYEKRSNGEYVRTIKADVASVKQFLENEYKETVKFLLADPEISSNQSIMYNIETYSRLIIVLIVGILVYFVPCISSKCGETLGQRALKLAVATRRTNTIPRKRDILLRSSIFILIDIFCPFLIYLKISYLALLPIFLTIIMMSFTKSQSSFHDSLSKTYIVYKSTLLNELNKDKKKKDYCVKHI